MEALDQAIRDLEDFADTHQETLQRPLGGTDGAPLEKREPTVTTAVRKKLVEVIDKDAVALNTRLQEFSNDGRMLMVGLLGFAVLVYVTSLACLMLLPSDQRLWLALGGTIAEGGLVFFLIRQIGRDRDRMAHLYKYTAAIKVLNNLRDLVQGLKAPEAVIEVTKASAELLKALQTMVDADQVPLTRSRLGRQPRPKG